VATVVIAANPYEAELCKKALAETGLSVEVAEGGDGLIDLIAAQPSPPLAVVIADGLFNGEMQDLLREVRDKYPGMPVFLIAERGGDVPDEAAATWLGARRLFFRPVEVEKFADAVEKLAVEAELAGEVSEQVEAVQPDAPEVEPAIEMEAEFESDSSPAPRPVPAQARSIGRLALKQVRREEPIIELPVRRLPTEVIVPGNGGSIDRLPPLESPPASIAAPPLPAPSSAEGILRADDAYEEEIVTGSFIVKPAPEAAAKAAAAGGVAAVETAPFGESPFTRRLDHELKAAERRLFPESAGRAPIYDDYDDALGDIDLDALGIDTMPGIGAEALDDALETPRPKVDPPKVIPPRETPSGLHQLASQREATVPSPPPTSSLPPALAPAPSMEESGTLSGERDLAMLLGSLHASGWTGRCVLSRGDGEKAIYFDNGLPVFASSTLVSDRLGDMLYREGKITREQHARTRELTVEPGRRTAVLFVELGLIKSAELFPALRRHVEEIIYSSFAWDGAAYRLEQEQALPEDKLRLSLHPWALFMEGIRRKYGLMRLVELLGPPETVLAPTTALARALGDCELNASERVAAELFDGERSLADVTLAIAGLPGVRLSETALYALGWGLSAVGAVRSVEPGSPGEEQGLGAVGERLGVRAVSTLVESASPARERRTKERLQMDKPADRAIDRERLLAKRAQISDCDYFMVLGVAREASDHEVRRAYDRLRADFARERFGEPVVRELGDTLDEIQEVLEEAYRVLMDQSLRSAYVSHLPIAE
jgi:hypothetical protein